MINYLTLQPTTTQTDSLQLGGGSLIPCSATGVSCEFVYFMEYGYVTIPMMCLTAFALVILFMLFHRKNSGI